MKILILGSTGVLGNTLNLYLKNRKNIHLNFISRKKILDQVIIWKILAILKS